MSNTLIIHDVKRATSIAKSLSVVDASYLKGNFFCPVVRIDSELMWDNANFIRIVIHI